MKIKYEKNPDGSYKSLFVIQNGKEINVIPEAYPSGHYKGVYIYFIGDEVQTDYIISTSKPEKGKIRFNLETEKWEFTNDGTHWFEFGSGGTSGTDEKVKASSTDSSAGYLEDKIDSTLQVSDNKLGLNSNLKSQYDQAYQHSQEEHNFGLVGSKEVDESNIGDNRILVYKSDTDKLVYQDIPSGGGGGNPEGVNGSVQYNENGNFGGNSSFIYDSSTNALVLTVKEGNILVDRNNTGVDEAIEWSKEAFKVNLDTSDKSWIRVEVRLKNNAWEDINLSLKIYNDAYGVPGYEIATSLNTVTIPADNQYRVYTFDFVKTDYFPSTVWVVIENYFDGLILDRDNSGTGEYAYWRDWEMVWVLEDNKRPYCRIYELHPSICKADLFRVESYGGAVFKVKHLGREGTCTFQQIGLEDAYNNVGWGFRRGSDYNTTGLFLTSGTDPDALGDPVFFIDRGGNVKIGCYNYSRPEKLTVRGNIVFAGSLPYWIGTKENCGFYIRTNNTNRVFFAENGSVGIGTFGYPASKLHINGSVSVKVLKVTGNYSAGDETVILCDATNGLITVTLPTAGIEGRVYSIKKIDNSTNKVVVQPSYGQTIDGGTNYELNAQNSFVNIISYQGSWYIIGKS